MLADLNEAVSLGRQATEITPPGHPGRAAILAILGAALRSRFEQTGALADLDEAITAERGAVEATPPGQPGRAGMLSNLGVALRPGSSGPGRWPTWTRQYPPRARQPRPPRPATRAGPGHCANLGGALQSRFMRTGALADLDQAITAAREAVEITSPGHPDQARMLSNLGMILNSRFEQTGDLADLDQAITATRAAAEATPPGGTGRAGALSNLGGALHPGSCGPGHWPTWIRQSPPRGRRPRSPSPATPTGPGCCPTSA